MTAVIHIDTTFPYSHFLQKAQLFTKWALSEMPTKLENVSACFGWKASYVVLGTLQRLIVWHAPATATGMTNANRTRHHPESHWITQIWVH